MPKQIKLEQSQLRELNSVFCAFYGFWSKTKEPVKLHPGTGSFDPKLEDEEGNWFCFAPRLREFLASQFLIVDRKTQIRDVEQHRNVTTHTFMPTMTGFQFYEEGRILKVATMRGETVEVGIGKPYATFNRIYRIVNGRFEAVKAPKYRTQKWFYSLYDEGVSWLGLKVDEAEQKAQHFASKCLSTWTSRRTRRLLTQASPAQGELSLTKFF